MKKLITALVIAALLLTLAPATVVYGAAGGVSSEAKGGNTAPTVDGVWLVETGDDTPVIAMVPLTEYRVKATIGDINTIDDIEDIEFHVYHTSNGAQSASSKWDADECAVFKWNKTTGWTMEDGGATTTWVLGTCTAPSVFTGTTGDWYLGFIPGELAQADASQNWHAWVRADDENKNGVGSTATGATMGAYSEISFDAAAIVFGTAAGIEPGQTGYITDPATQYLTPQVGTNATYALGSKSDATWNGGGPNIITLSESAVIPPATSGQFTLIIDNETSGGGAPKFVTQGVTASNVTITGLGALGRTATIDEGDEGTSDTQLWMALSFALDGINEVIYAGTITFTVTN